MDGKLDKQGGHTPYVKRPHYPLVISGLYRLLDSGWAEVELETRVRVLLFNNQAKLARIVLHTDTAGPAKEIGTPGSGPEPTDFLLRLIAATVALDGDFIGILEHEMSSLRDQGGE